MRVLCNACFLAEACALAFVYIPRRAALRDPFIWLEVVAVLPFAIRSICYPHTLSTDRYLAYGEVPTALRVFESLSSVRVLKVCR